MLYELDCLNAQGGYCMKKNFLESIFPKAAGLRVKIIQISSSHWWRFITATTAICKGLWQNYIALDGVPHSDKYGAKN